MDVVGAEGTVGVGVGGAVGAEGVVGAGTVGVGVGGAVGAEGVAGAGAVGVGVGGTVGAEGVDVDDIAGAVLGADSAGRRGRDGSLFVFGGCSSLLLSLSELLLANTRFLNMTV